MEGKVKKAAYTASIMQHFKAFHLPYLALLKQQGYSISLIAGDDMELPHCDRRVQVPFCRSPFKLRNLMAYRMLKRDFDEQKYDLIHCHTPAAGILTRLAARKTRKKNGTRVFYTAHGFHFYKGAPLVNWLLFFPAEWICSFFTDVLITINQEDYAFAKKHMHAKEVQYVPGVGVDLEKFRETELDRAEKRREIGVPPGDKVILSVGELNENKNHEVILKAIAQLEREDISYVLCGKGNRETYLKELAASLRISEKVHFLGYRHDVAEIMACCDMFAFPSKREGLPVALMEAMALGRPVIASKIRGNVDLIDEGKGGFLYPPDDTDGFAEGLKKIIENPEPSASFGAYNAERVQTFDIRNVIPKMKLLYFSETESGSEAGAHSDIGIGL